jgi:hypothetical protein
VQITQRRMRLTATVAARSAAGSRPSWHAIFTKAYALVALTCPQLRRAYLPFPRAHYYEHPSSVASVALERRVRDEDVVLYAPVARPDALSLPDLDLQLRRYKDQPLEKVSAFRRALLLTSWPRWVRWSVWSLTLNALGQRRAAVLGTYAVSACSALGADLLQPPALLTSTLTYGVIEADGWVDVRILSDPRVLDAPLVARVLADLERVLTHDIVAELRYLERLAAA